MELRSNEPDKSIPIEQRWTQHKMAGKLVAWWLALGSGTSGGTLAPILLVSASFGTA